MPLLSLPSSLDGSFARADRANRASHVHGAVPGSARAVDIVGAIRNSRWISSTLARVARTDIALSLMQAVSARSGSPVPGVGVSCTSAS